MQKIELGNKVILVTGAAGFIGSNLVKRLFKDVRSATIIGIDNMNDYYDVSLKEYRLKELEDLANTNLTNEKDSMDSSDSCSENKWVFIKGDIADKKLIDEVFSKYQPSIVVNLAAQAGVRYSITNPDAYIMSNMIGFYNILEACRHSVELVKGQKSKAALDLSPQTLGNQKSKAALDLSPQTLDNRNYF